MESQCDSVSGRLARAFPPWPNMAYTTSACGPTLDPPANEVRLLQERLHELMTFINHSPANVIQELFSLGHVSPLSLKHRKRSNARQEIHKYKHWRKPGPSRLRNVVSVDDFEVSAETLKQEAEKMLDGLRREANKRNVPPLPYVTMAESNVVFGVEPAQPSGTGRIGEGEGECSVDEAALFEQFVNMNMFENEPAKGSRSAGEGDDVEMSDDALFEQFIDTTMFEDEPAEGSGKAGKDDDVEVSGTADM
jgi:hypothetical protein